MGNHGQQSPPDIKKLFSVASTTGWGAADTLDVVLDRISKNVATATVELSIGAKPVGNPDDVLDRFRSRFEFIGHHAMPLGEHTMVRPFIGRQDQLVGVCHRFGLRQYTAHPPNRKQVDLQGFYRWAAEHYEALNANNIKFGVETMYVPQCRNEAIRSGGYYLSTPSEVEEFVLWAEQQGWIKPLLVDASHLHIGYRAGLWTQEQIKEIISSSFVLELHLSENDGVKDSHSPLTGEHIVTHWLSQVDISEIEVVVDEGKRQIARNASLQNKVF